MTRPSVELNIIKMKKGINEKDVKATLDFINGIWDLLPPRHKGSNSLRRKATKITAKLISFL